MVRVEHLTYLLFVDDALLFPNGFEKKRRKLMEILEFYYKSHVWRLTYTTLLFVSMRSLKGVEIFDGSIFPSNSLEMEVRLKYFGFILNLGKRD